MLTLGTTLAIFLMLGISSLALFWAKRLNLPHTVLLVLIGIGLGFLALLPNFSFLSEFHLTPELLFYLLLPTLIFESAYHMNVRKLVADSSAVLLLAIGSFLISTILITALLHFALLLIGITIPFGITLLFGALISATDPVAVLALFKEYGVPRRLSLIFEGESLFNDATAVALFLITLEVINSGGITVLSSLEGLLSFTSMLVFGVLFGLLVGGIFTYLVGVARESEVASITLTIVLAHITFIMAEVISHTVFFWCFFNSHLTNHQHHHSITPHGQLRTNQTQPPR
jgi:CPA1 family monovalent cation:H+ antiporter